MEETVLEFPLLEEGTLEELEAGVLEEGALEDGALEEELEEGVLELDWLLEDSEGLLGVWLLVEPQEEPEQLFPVCVQSEPLQLFLLGTE